jgi:peptidoglycan/LPS O-acetylase OafA/YrhL
MTPPVTPTDSSHSESGAQETSQRRSIPSLDGLRAISVGLVILSHYGPEEMKGSTWNSYFFFLGQMGVNMFFVISGFLITFLLCKERAETSTISLKSFYFRRALRIFPAFYVYLAVAGTLTAIGIFHINVDQFILAGSYLWNYYMPQNGSILGHTWSLALEEQFYVFWPTLLKILRPKHALFMAIGLIVVEPVARVITYMYLPGLRESGKISAMFHTRIDTIMFGCLIALVWRHHKFKRFADRYLRAPAFYISCFFLLCINPVLNLQFRVAYHAFWLTMEGVALSIALIYLVRRPATLPGRFVNIRLLRYVGVLSYSLYLWQQMFVEAWHDWFPLNLLAALCCAVLSFYFVEKPALRLRNALAV